MLRLSIKSTLAHKRRLVGTALSVIIGVAFLAGTFIFTDTIKRTFDNLFADVYDETDAAVRSSQSLDVQFGGTVRDRISDAVIGDVAEIPGVVAAVGDVQGFARIVGADGDPLGRDDGPPTFGGNLSDSPLSPWRLTAASRYPSGPDEAVVDAGSAEEGGLEIGRPVTIIGQGGSRQFTLVGIARFGDTDSPGGTTYALFDLPTAQAFVGKPGEVDAVLAKSDGSLSEQEFAQRLRQDLPADANLEVLTGTEMSEESSNDVEQGLSFFTVLLLVFAGISLFVSSFIIYNTFAIIVAQRQRENALLRAVGASRTQVLGAMLFEAVIIGVVASVLGFLGGLAISMLLKAGLAALNVDIPAGGIVLLPRTAVVSAVVGILVTVVAAVAPSVRASRVPPVAALHDVALDRSATSRRRLIIGGFVTAVALALTVAGLAGIPILLAPGIPLLFIGLFVLGPLMARPVSRLIGAPLPRLKGMTGTLARENAMRNPKRTARTAAALMVGVALVTGISVLAASIKSSLRDIFDEQFTGDFVVSSSASGFGGLPPTLAEQLDQLPEVDAATGIGIGYGRIGDGDDSLTLIDPATAGEVFDLEFTDGAMGDLTDAGIMLSTSRAESGGVAIGDSLTLTLLDGQPRALTVQGIYDQDELAGPYTITKQLYAESGADQFDFSVFIRKAPDVSDAAAQTAIEGVAAAYPNGEVESRVDYIDGQAAAIDPLVNLIYGLLALAVVIAVFGIANTLSLSIYERTRELGLLRAVGMIRAQVRSSVRWESVITALLGTVQGVVIGVLLSYAVVFAMRDEGFGRFTLPVAAVVVILVLAVIAGLVAAVRPARPRPARLDVLHAIATE